MSVVSSLGHLKRDLKIAASFSNPGILYNMGNAAAMLGSLLFFVLLSLRSKGPTTIGVYDHFIGSWPTFATSFASIIFWISGIKYAQAWSHGFPPESRANSMGHCLSTLGAVAIGLALIGLARSEVTLALAIIATILHVSGKYMSWVCPTADSYFKPMPLYSRIAVVTSLLLDIRHDVLASNLLLIVLPSFLILANLFFARADLMLLPKTK